MTTENDGYYEAYWPRGARQQKTRALAPRLDTLDGKTVAQIWDFLFKGDEVFALPALPLPLPLLSSRRRQRKKQ